MSERAVQRFNFHENLILKICPLFSLFGGYLIEINRFEKRNYIKSS